MPDWMRLAFGTLTILRVPAPRAIHGGAAMVAAPLVALVLALPTALLLGLLTGPAHTSTLLAAALAVGLLAVLTRGLHLDGLADTADGLGSGRRGEEALAIMRRSDIGPFGVVTLLLVVLIDVCALASLSARPWVGVAAAGCAVVTSRAALPLACRRGIPAARPDGLGAAVAGTVSPVAAAVVVLVVIAVTAGAGGAVAGSRGAVAFGVATVAALVIALGVTARCRSRFGGISGDTLGAAVEASLATSLVVAAVAFSALS